MLLLHPKTAASSIQTTVIHKHSTHSIQTSVQKSSVQSSVQRSSVQSSVQRSSVQSSVQKSSVQSSRIQTTLSAQTLSVHLSEELVEKTVLVDWEDEDSQRRITKPGDVCKLLARVVPSDEGEADLDSDDFLSAEGQGASGIVNPPPSNANLPQSGVQFLREEPSEPKQKDTHFRPAPQHLTASLATTKPASPATTSCNVQVPWQLNGLYTLDDLRRAQGSNDKSRIASWKAKIHADSESQRLLIAKAVTHRFLKSSLQELKEKRASQGEVRRAGGKARHEGFMVQASAASLPFYPDDRDASPSPSRPGSAPLQKPTRQASWFKFMPPRPQTAQGPSGSDRHHSLKHSNKAPSSAQQRVAFLETISSAFNQDRDVIDHGLRAQLALQARDARLAYTSAAQALPGAQLVTLHASGPKKERQRITHEEKRRQPSDKRPPNRGLALLLDPSVDTRGKRVKLYVRYDDGAAQQGGGAGAWGGSPLNTARGGRLSGRSRSPPNTHRRPTSSPAAAASAPAAAHLQSVTRSSTAPGHTLTRTLTNTTTHTSTSNSPSRSPSPARSRRSIRERSYRLRGRGRFDLTLTTNASADTGGSSGSAHNLGTSSLVGSGTSGGVSCADDYDSIVDDYMETYLPGWEGVLPIFVPGNVCVCHVEVEEEEPGPQTATASTAFSSSSHSSSSSSSAQHPRPSSAAAYSSLQRDEERSSAVVTASLCAFPCRSQGHALSLLQAHMGEAGFFRKHTANVTVPGGMPALHVAAFHGNLAAVKRLLDNGAAVNLRASIFPKNTALHEAVMGGHEDVIRCLLGCGAKQTAADEAGNCALHVAALQNNVRVARLLLKSDGAATALARRNGKGFSAFELATSAFMKATLETGMRSFGISTRRR